MSTTELSLGPDAIRQITTGEVAMQVIDHKQVESGGFGPSLPCQLGLAWVRAARLRF